MRADVTPGQTSDHRGFDLVMGDDLPAPAALLGDKGYDSDRIRAWAEARDGVPVALLHEACLGFTLPVQRHSWASCPSLPRRATAP